MTADFGGLRMKHLNKIIALISALCLVLGMFSGCKGVEVEHKDYAEVVKDVEYTNLENGVVAESDTFEMIWHKSVVDESGKEVVDESGKPFNRAMIEFKSKIDNSVWSTTPKEYYDTADPSMLYGNGLINSSLVITALKGEQVFAYDAYEYCIMNGEFSSTKLKDKNGIAVTYYFREAGAIVTVDYYLEDGAFKVSVDPKNINSYVPAVSAEDDRPMHNAAEEGEIMRIISVTPAPYMCSTQNTVANSKDSYFALPSGSGALMYVDQRSYDEDGLDGIARTFGDPDFNMPNDYYGWVYGEDTAVDKYNAPINDTPVTMPFYGIKKGKNALCAIIEQSAESCKISAKAGGSDTGVGMFDDIGTRGYSYISATYNVLGYNQVYTKSAWRVHYNPYVESNIEPLVIGYYPLSGDQANYSGMAKCYQNYLIEKENLQKSQGNKVLNVKLYGSYIQDELFAGIPYDKEVALTTYSEATEILGELKKISGGSLTAVMQGYGDGGINADELAGGYTLESAAGDEDDLRKFVEYTKNENIQTFFNFDTINYFESGNGYSIKNDSALNVNGIPTTVYNFFMSTRDRYDTDKGGKVGTLIAREQLDDAANDAVALLDGFGIPGIGFDTLGNTCYSDYDTYDDSDTNFKYPLRSKMAADVKKTVEDIKKNSKTVLMDGAFSYAAVAADVITNVPTSSAKLNSFDLEIPLYQMVFQGYRSNCVVAINIANNQRTQFLKAIETGSGLSFELINNYDREIRKQTILGLNAAYYQDNVKLITDCVNEAESFLKSVSDKAIVEHRYVSNNVARTTFENGVVVYVNYNDTDKKVGKEIIKAQSFLVKEGTLSEK